VERNPYEPSSAPLAEATEARSAVRPRAVTIAVSLLAANLAVGFWRGGFGVPAIGAHDVPVLVTVIPFVGPVALAWLCYKIFMGRNWARMTMLVWTCVVFSVQMLRFNMPLPEGVMARPSFAAYLIGLQSALILVALYLLFVPGREWFGRR
jgi:hypothetical protein